MSRRKSALHAVLIALVAGVAFPQDRAPERVPLLDLEWGDTQSQERTKSLHERAEGLDEGDATELRRALEKDARDIETRMVLLFYELPELRKKRRAKNDPKPHGRLVLGLIEQHPRSRLAGTAGLLLYPYKRDGMYTGPAWDAAIELWEKLAAAHPKDAAIACNAGTFLISDPFLMERDGPRALVLLERARSLEPTAPRWALKLGAFHWMNRSMGRTPEGRSAAAAAGIPHLRAAWEMTEASERASLDVWDKPLCMVLASMYFDASAPESARAFARLALDGLDTEAPRGDVVYEMNVVLGRLALAAGDAEEAARYLLAAGETTGSAVLGSFGPDMTLARELLAAGKRDAVLEFLGKCLRFWTSGGDDLRTWIRTIEEGGDPWSKPPK